MSRTEILLLVIGAAILLLGLFLLIWSMIEIRRLSVSYFNLSGSGGSEAARREFPATKQALSAFPQAKPQTGPRVVFFSDLHAGHMRVPLQILINSIRHVKPELVLFGGDLCSTEKDKEFALSYLEMIAAALLAEGIPFYGVWGNHDSVLTRDELEEHGITMLRNQSALFRAANGEDWLLVGLDDHRTGKPDLNMAYQNLVPKERQLHLKLRADAVPQSRTLVLAHNPDTAIGLPSNKFAYVLSGHNHGGQINLPFKLGYRSLRNDRAWREGYFKGFYPIKDFRLFISRGVGAVMIPLRLCARPELVVFDCDNNKQQSE